MHDLYGLQCCARLPVPSALLAHDSHTLLMKCILRKEKEGTS